jgi:short-chain Z-isoprenyl diphosphate synthase
MKNVLYRLYERRLLREIEHQPLPHHLGLILDGHRRFARSTGVSNAEGYARGADKTEEVLHWCAALGIRTVTLWLLSTENLGRDPHEVGAILEVIEERIAAWVDEGLARRLALRIRLIGNLELLPASAFEVLTRAEARTREHTGMRVNVAVGYGGRQEIVDAVRSYLRERQVQNEPVESMVEGLTVDAVAKYLYAYDCSDPDLIIRTSGEVRLSGFMLWQSAYSEYYFCDVFWPAFRKVDFLRAIRSYQERQRRFGR